MNTENYRFNLGSFNCVVINDGFFTYQNPAQVLFANAPDELLSQALRKHNINPEQWQEWVSPYSGLIINTGEYLVLVDTGAGKLAPTTGRLITNLKAEGIAPEDIDKVVLTHGHPDHIGGNVDNESNPAFRNARYVIWKDEWNFWTLDPDLSSLQVDEHLKQLMVMYAQKNLLPIRNQIDLVDCEMEIVPGIHVFAVPGHTVGHMAVIVSSDNEYLLCISDVAIHPIHLEYPDWYAAVDLNPQQALISRRCLLEMAITKQALVYGFHFPFPCLGNILIKNNSWQWHSI